MKIALAQQNYRIGDFAYNTQKIIQAIQKATSANADLVVFSELCICGYPPRDFLLFDEFIQSCLQAIDQIKPYTKNIAVVIGSPASNPQKKGKDLFNSAYFIYQEKIQAVIHKTLLPTYDVFDEYRHFEPAYIWNTVSFKGKKLAITICEDIWDLVDNPMYRKRPMDILITQQPDIMINLSASPFDYTHIADRKAIVKANVLTYQLPMVYCNTVGSQTEIVFDGGSLVADKHGNICCALPLFEEDIQTIDILDNGTIAQPIIEAVDTLPTTDLNPTTLHAHLCVDEIYSALKIGIQDYFNKMGFTKAILGSSGGIDSAVTLALACDALGHENVLAVLMPSPYSTTHSVDDAIALSNRLNNPYHIIQINTIYESFVDTLQPLFNNLPFGIAEENMQSRTRGNLLMAIANKFGYILLNTSNKSELATGYGTLYGDMAGGISILGDCYKTQVYALAQYINRQTEIIPTHIITKAPSAELRPNQKDRDSLPDYAVLDQILYQYIEQCKGPKSIMDKGFDPSLVSKILSMVNNNEYKRNQFCPIIRISPKAFGVGRRMPIVGKYLS